MKILIFFHALALGALLLFVQPVTVEANIQAMRSVEVLTLDDEGLPVRFPFAVSYDPGSDEIYVTSPRSKKLVVYTSDYFPYLSLGTGRGLQGVKKTYIKDGLIYVCSSGGEDDLPHIAVYDMAFMPVRKIYFPHAKDFYPYDLVVGVRHNIYVVGLGGTGVMVLDEEGNFLHWIEPTDEVLGVTEKAPILALDVGDDGKLYFLSEWMGRVYVYDQAERFLRRFGEKGGEAGKLARPRGIAVDDAREQVYLVDYQRHTMSVFSFAGKFLFEVGGLGAGRGWFYYPSDVEVDGRGRVIVADTFNHRLQVFEFVSNKGFGDISGLQLGGDDRSETSADAEKQVEKFHFRRLKDDLSLEADGDYLVLIAFTREVQDAEILQMQLADKGIPTLLREVTRAVGGNWHQLLAGPYQDPFVAYSLAKKLREESGLPVMLKTLGDDVWFEVPEEEQSEPSAEEGVEEVFLPQGDIPAVGKQD